MTSIILSNRVNERDSTVAKDDSIYKAWNFRNNMSSNVILPPNSQVALQSCKVNVDGTYALAPEGSIFYNYYGQQLGGATNITQYQTTSKPVQAILSGLSDDGNLNANTEGMRLLIRRALNLSSHHPNNMGRYDVERKVNATTGEFEGFIYKLLDQYRATTNLISPYAVSGYTPNQYYSNLPAKNWIYGLVSGVGEFQADADKPYPAVAVLPQLPLSLIEGEFIVDFSDANTKNMDWAVGLTRSNSVGKQGQPDTILAPKYWSKERGGDWQFDFYADYVVYRFGDSLYLAHTILNPAETEGYIAGDPYSTYTKDLDYTQNGIGQFKSVYDLQINADAFTQVKWTIKNETIQISLLKANNTDKLLYKYAPVGVGGRTKFMNLKPISQVCRCLHPILYVDTSPTVTDAKLKVTSYMGAPLGAFTDVSSVPLFNKYNAGDSDGLFVGWWEDLSRNGFQQNAWAFETRNWNNYDPSETETHTYLALQNSDKNLAGEPILIVKPDEKYFNSGNANTSELMGFRNNAVVDTFELGTGILSETFIQESTTIPKLLNTRAIFVRLDNIPTNNINAFKGNKSTILSMLPRLNSQSETGRIFYEPNNLMYVDLQNQQELRLNSFDISFCNVDETFSTTLSGQSVVVLHFKVKGE